MFPPVCIGEKPRIEYQVLKSDDAGININIHTWTVFDWEQIVFPFCYFKRDALGEIRIRVYVTNAPNYYYELYESWPPYDNKHIQDLTIPLNITSFTYLGSGSYSLGLFRGWHISIYAKVVDDDDWDWDPFDGGSEFKEVTWSNVAIIYDDDNTPPDTYLQIGSYGDILITDSRNYKIDFTASDYSGWTGVLYYKFENSTYTSPTYFDSLGSTSSKSRVTLSFYIPRSTWVNYPNTEIKINYRCLLYTSPSPRDLSTSRMPSSA